MDDMEEENDIHDQISNAISRGHGDPLDDVSIHSIPIHLKYSYFISLLSSDLHLIFMTDRRILRTS